MAESVIGIDLGTASAVVATTDQDGNPTLLRDRSQVAVQPAIVGFTDSGAVLTGDDARRLAATDPANAIHSFKRIIGRPASSPQVAHTAAHVAYAIREGPNEQPMIGTPAGEFSVPEISAIVIDHLRNIARQRLGREVRHAVIAVPASFTDAQRSSTATAGAIAGLVIPHVVNEPTAAAIAYGHKRGLSELCAVYDFGAGSFDVTLLHLRGDVFEVLGSAGDSFLGGIDVEHRIADVLANRLRETRRIDVSGDPVALQRLAFAGRQALVELSVAEHVVVRLPELAPQRRGEPGQLHVELTREHIASCVAPLAHRTLELCNEALTLAQLSPGHIAEVVLVGGCTRNPLVRELVAQHFGRPPRTDVNPEESVALGTALQAEALRKTLGTAGIGRQTFRGSPPPKSPPMEARDSERGSGPNDVTLLGAIEPDATPTPSRRTAQRVAEAEQREIAPTSPEAMIAGAGRAAESDAGDDVEETGDYTAVEDVPPTGMLDVPFDPRSTLPMGRRRAAEPDISFRPVRFSGDELRVTAREFSRPLDLVPLSGDGDDASPNPTPPNPTPRSAIDSHARTNPAHRAASAPDALPRTRGESRPVDRLDGVLRGGIPIVAGVPLVLDVAPHSVGLGTVGGFCEPLVARNSRIPTQQRRVFTTSHDRQSTVRIRICQGESRRLAENAALGELVLDQLPPRPRGQTQIEVTFVIDASAILHVTARDIETDLVQSSAIQLRGTPEARDLDLGRAKLAGLMQ